jgi:hypothetical protein
VNVPPTVLDKASEFGALITPSHRTAGHEALRSTNALAPRTKTPGTHYTPAFGDRGVDFVDFQTHRL